MKIVKYTYIDSKTMIPVTEQPAGNGPKNPDIDGLEFLFAEESGYPTDVPVFYGQCPDSSDTDRPGVLAQLSQAELDAARDTELDRRKARARAEVDRARDRHLFTNIPYTFPGDTEPDAIQLRDERDRQNIQDNAIDAINKAPEATMYFMPLSNNLKTITAADMIAMGQFLKARGDAIYNAAWTKKGEVMAAATLEALRAIDLNAGWPE